MQVTGLGGIEPLNRLHGFDLLLTTADGKLVTGATIVLTAIRIDSNNPLPTAPQVFPTAEPGHYRAEGLRFHVPGEWRLTLAIALHDIRDIVELPIIVK